MAPGAPMKVSPAAGMIWLNWPPPRVCLPGANQYVLCGSMVQLWASAVPLSSPARITTAPLGGDEGPPPRIALLPHTCPGAGTEAGGGALPLPAEDAEGAECC